MGILSRNAKWRKNLAGFDVPTLDELANNGENVNFDRVVLSWYITIFSSLALEDVSGN